MDDLIKEKFNNQQKSIDNHETRITYLEKNTAILEKMDYRIGNVEKSITQIDSKLDQKQNEKQKDIKSCISFFIEAILTILIGYIAIKLGLK